MTEIEYVKGDATQPRGKGRKVIVHVCNDLGGWGKGFVLAISKRWREPEREYRAWHRNRADNDFALGAVQFVPVDGFVWVANIIGQRGMKTGSNGPPVRYEAIAVGLITVSEFANEHGASVHMPRIGCGLAGGKWERIEPLIQRTLCQSDVHVTVYDFAG